MSPFAGFWFALAGLQLVVAGYGLAAAIRWRGARLWPAPEAPLGRAPAALAAVVVVALFALLIAVGDADFARYVGTGAVMLTAIVLVLLLVRRQSRGG